MATPTNITRTVQGITYKRKNGVWYELGFDDNGRQKEVKVVDPLLLNDLKNNISKDESPSAKRTSTPRPVVEPVAAPVTPAPAPAPVTPAPAPAPVTPAPVTPAPKPYKVGDTIPDSATKPKPIPTKTTYLPKIGAVYNVPSESESERGKTYSVLILSPKEAKITNADGTIENVTLNKDAYLQLQEWSDKGYGPPLSSAIVETSTGKVVENTGETTEKIPSNVPLITSVAAERGSSDFTDYVDRSRTELLQDIELSNALLKDSVNVLQNTVIPDTKPPKTLADQINESGITDELLAQYPKEVGEYNQRLKQKQAILEAIKQKIKECAPASETNASWSADRECSDGFNFSQLRALEKEYEDEVNDLPDPCGKSTLASINNALLKFFKFLKGVKKYYNLYVKGTINKIKNLSSIIANISQIIAAVLKLLVQRMRNYLINLLRKLIEKAINKILTSLTKALKNTVIKAIVDSLICAFNKIIDGLSSLVADFLFSLIGNVINAGFCAVEQFTNALLNNLAASIDKAIAPILNGINDVLGGVAKIAGSVFQAMDYILGFEAFLCAKPNCPEIKSFKADPLYGPTPAMEEAFNNFLPIPDAAGAENWVLDKVDQFLDKNNVLTGATIFGDKYSDLDKNISSKDQALLGPCNTGAWRCGPPQVEFFGGGGIGAVGDAVVNSIGEVVGVNLRFGGTGYTSPPFVTFNDNCGNGNFASAYTITNSSGEVVKVIMVNSGIGYLPAPTGLDEFGLVDEEQLLGQQVVNQTREYVGCLDEIQVINTGIGYSPEDSVTIEPDIPGLQVGIQMTEVGQIVAMNVQTPGCGISEIPTITINSTTGAGLDVRPILTFTDKNQYLQNVESRSDFNAEKVIKVTQCVYK